MKIQPAIRSGPVLLAPLRPGDAGRICLLAGDDAVADMAVRMPHPYPERAAEAWIAESTAGWKAGWGAVWKITRANDGLLVGEVGVTMDPENRSAELGYWIGKDYWGRGYATAGAWAAVQFGFEEMGIHRIHASCLRRNAGSARVLERAGLRYEGCLREHLFHRGCFEDLLLFGAVRDADPYSGEGEGGNAAEGCTHHPVCHEKRLRCLS